MNEFKQSKNLKLAALQFNETFFKFGKASAYEELNFNDLEHEDFLENVCFELQNEVRLKKQSMKN